MRHRLSVRGVAALLATAAAAPPAIWWLTAPYLVDPLLVATMPPETAVAGGCADLLVVAAGWLTLGVLTALVEVITGGGVGSVRWFPRALRLVVAAACGAGLAATAAPAGADTGIGGLPFPDRPTGGTPARVVVRPNHPTVVVVRTGDCLWDIAAAHLPRSADDARVIHGWQALYAANRAVIGLRPDLIHPGQRLVLPSVLATKGSSHAH